MQEITKMIHFQIRIYFLSKLFFNSISLSWSFFLFPQVSWLRRGVPNFTLQMKGEMCFFLFVKKILTNTIMFPMTNNLDSMLWVLYSSYWIPDSLSIELEFWYFRFLQLDSTFQGPVSRIPQGKISQIADSTFIMQEFVWFLYHDHFTWRDLFWQ